MYKKLLNNDEVIKEIITGSTFLASSNKEYQQWLLEGNTPEPAETTTEKKARLISDLRSKRNLKIQEQQNKIDRHRRQLDMGIPTTLTDSVYQNLLLYIQELCDMPTSHVTISKLESPNWPIL